ncbi:MAG TPA: multicopper oxidase family protein, partial [Pseudonocardiaceae bacterium]|nr:multicopper oxidase family protein [Pseudonocardiaceae bacterium]
PRRRLLRPGVSTVVVAALVTGVGVVWSSASVLPGSFSMMNTDDVDYGGGPATMVMPGAPGSVDVTSLTGPLTGKPDDTFVLTAAKKQVTLSSGKVEEGAAFNNQIPGPQLTVHQGDLVQVTLVNKLPADGLTLHWHGLNVPNAEDGVAGVTQNAVAPGHSFTYRFRVVQTGSYWYHTHNDPASLVRAGLFGAFVVLPRMPIAQTTDITEMAHTWQGGDDPAFGTSDTLRRNVIASGTQVRLRLINTDNNPVGGAGRAQARNFGIAGTPYRVVAIDGNDINQPTQISGDRLLVAAGGRYDVTFTMPNSPVRLTDISVPGGGELFSPTGGGTVDPITAKAPVFDPARYGMPAPMPFTVDSNFNRRFTLVLDDHLGFYNGVWSQMPTINGESFPNIPMLVVHGGDLVEETIINRSHNNHPMHLHGHTALVLSVNGKPTTGSPWYTDTLDIEPGQTYQIGFLADNPGVWMDHCHNLDHSAAGMMTMLMYDNVSSPFLVGPNSGNTPD